MKRLLLAIFMVAFAGFVGYHIDTANVLWFPFRLLVSLVNGFFIGTALNHYSRNL